MPTSSSVCTARNRVSNNQSPGRLLVSYMTLARLYLHFLWLTSATSLQSRVQWHHQSMETPPIHVLLALDAQILGGEVGYGTSAPSSPVVSLTGHDDDDEDWSPESPALGRDGPATVADEGEGTARTVSTDHASNVGARRTRSSTGNSCPASASAAAASSPPPRHRRDSTRSTV